MKVDSNRPPEGRGPGGPNARGAQKAGGSAAPADRASISGWDQEVADLTAAVDRLPDVREARVRELRQAVESGTYQVDPMQVAIGILREL